MWFLWLWVSSSDGLFPSVLGTSISQFLCVCFLFLSEFIFLLLQLALDDCLREKVLKTQITRSSDMHDQLDLMEKLEALSLETGVVFGEPFFS